MPGEAQQHLPVGVVAAVVAQGHDAEPGGAGECAEAQHHALVGPPGRTEVSEAAGACQEDHDTPPAGRFGAVLTGRRADLYSRLPVGGNARSGT